ncbi:cob(I)yrinic acid a,c-diamide adenosyltransferase [Agarivorans sp. Toyoura001]|uniref:cob(I)yrinic acid a,c-diamide adenosyltransferase n=1 Tax=Agarivorans sp. Toyoura001 TaxID=2283141 RepID=UPI0010E92432|nr:cob(I)yrinic acid a,c-diamide adenosyltransferase [Agarivorans sp. Toyoura001]GDY26124.1 cob(I)yrinic acid a,c-diamide adenosyltransferase [Agarivorans sp. Toyoura001]
MSKDQEKHQQRQEKLKASVDAKVEDAQIEKGLLLVITGNGKGKSTAGFGNVARATGHGYKAVAAQFIKGGWECGERNLLEKNGVEFAVMATGFTWETQNRELDTQAAQEVWQRCKQWLADPSIYLVLLDEITYMLSYDYLDVDEVVAAIEQRPKEQSVVVTGRACHRKVIELADTVSEVKNVKHAFESGIKARQGVDW